MQTEAENRSEPTFVTETGNMSEPFHWNEARSTSDFSERRQKMPVKRKNPSASGHSQDGKAKHLTVIIQQLLRFVKGEFSNDL